MTFIHYSNCKNAVLILGDSTSMTIGLECLTYPYLLADDCCWPESTFFINCSQPGFTSADICSFYFREKKWINCLRAIIINIGTCDSTSSEIKKGKFNISKQLHFQCNDLFKVKKIRKKLKNALLHYEWNNSFDMTIERPEELSDYLYNIERIIKSSNRMNIPVVLIKPKSHVNFPSGIGKGNFVFYKYVGIKDNLSDKLRVLDERFVRAYKMSDDGLYNDACLLYKEILMLPLDGFTGIEFQLLCLNNYACCKAEGGEYEEAEYLFDLLLNEIGVRTEIVLFNVAQLYRLKGNKKDYLSTLNKSYEFDSSMYRIRSQYISAIESLAIKYKEKVKLIDISAIIDDYLYIDHCHQLPKGQHILAENVKKCLIDFGFSGFHEAKIVNKLFNPELALGNYTEFFDYYKAWAPYTEEQIERYKQNIKSYEKTRSLDTIEIDCVSNIPKEFKYAIDYYQRHPCFTSIDDVMFDCIKYPSDIGRFPEFYLIRYIIPYLRFSENNEELQNRFQNCYNILRKSDLLELVLPERVRSLVCKNVQFSDNNSEHARLIKILKNIRIILKSNTLKGNIVYERLKTTIFWFFRESLRFGTHSRYSMRYDRIQLEYTSEALCVAGIIDLHLGGNMKSEILELIGLLKRIVECHEFYCEQFYPDKDNSILLSKYDSKLLEISKEI